MQGKQPQADLKKLVDLGMQKDVQMHMRPVIEKELLHYDILLIRELRTFGGKALNPGLLSGNQLLINLNFG